MIERLRRALLGVVQQRPTLDGPAAPEVRAVRNRPRGDADTRIEAARRRLKASIPPPED